MKREDAQVLREVQKKTERAMKAVQALSNKVYDDDLALQLSRQSLKYSEIHNRAMDKMLESRVEPCHGNALEEMRLVGAIHGNTLFNTSTSRIAEVMMQESSRSIAGMCRALNRHESAAGYSVELAKEFVDFEEKNRERMKKYL